MAVFVKAVQISKSINNVTKLLNNFSLSSKILSRFSPQCSNQRLTVACLHTTSQRSDLMEFFEDKKHWGRSEIKCGRSWKLDELRIKSNEDLHKLWFVLLKERNMLMTMEEACKENWQVFPNPERIDKVEDSMKNLETVVRERNTAYHLLETGENGERPSKIVYNQLGMKMRHTMQQYRIPKHMNTKWQKENIFSFGGYAVMKFRRLYREKLWNEKRKAHNRDIIHVRKLIEKFPNLDYEALKQKYPGVDVEKVKGMTNVRGHYVPK